MGWDGVGRGGHPSSFYLLTKWLTWSESTGERDETIMTNSS